MARSYRSSSILLDTGLYRRRVPFWKRGYFWWLIVIVLTPLAVHGAYEPASLLAGNNLSDVQSASTSRTNLGLGSIATQSAASVAITGGTIDGTVIGGTTRAAISGTTANFNGAMTTNVTGSTQCLHVNTSGVITGTGSDCGSGTSIVPTVVTQSGASPITLSSTNLVTNVISMGTPAASTLNLPSAVTAGNGFRSCVKDGTTNFATNNATVKSPTSGTIDGTAGSTGIVMSQTKMQFCFISDGTNWWIE